MVVRWQANFRRKTLHVTYASTMPGAIAAEGREYAGADEGTGGGTTGVSNARHP